MQLNVERGAPMTGKTIRLRQKAREAGQDEHQIIHGNAYDLADLELLVRHRIGRGAGEPGEHLALAQAPHLARVALHDGVAERDLAIAGNDHAIALADRHDGGGVEDIGVLAGIHAALRGRIP